jgi:hypothetical protein
MVSKFINIVFVIGLSLIYLSVYFFSIVICYANLKYVNQIRTGEIVHVKYSQISGTEGIYGYYRNTIKEDISNDTLYGNTQKQYELGDKVKYRWLGQKGGNVIFEVNNTVIGTRYGVMDILLPFVFVIMSYILFRFIKSILKK